MSLVSILDGQAMHYAAKGLNALTGKPMQKIGYMPLQEFLDNAKGLGSSDAIHVARGDIQDRYAKLQSSGLDKDINPAVPILITQYTIRSFKGEKIEYPFGSYFSAQKRIDVSINPGETTISEMEKLVSHAKEAGATKLYYLTTEIADKGQPLKDQPILYKAELGRQRYGQGIEIIIVGVPTEKQNLEDGSKNRVRAEYNRATVNYLIELMESRNINVRKAWQALNARRKRRDEF